MSNSSRVVAAAFCQLLVCCCLAAAQQGGNAATPGVTEGRKTESSDSPALHVEESRPPVYYLPDKQGNLQPVLDFKYQDFVKLYKLKHQLDRREEPPRGSLLRMTATGTAGIEYGELNVQFQVLVRDDGWVRVPLRLDQGLLRGAVQYKGPGEHFVQYEGNGEGYVCWIRGNSDAQHEITMTLLVPLTVAGDETRLSLFGPRAAASELKLTVPVAGAVGKVSEGATLVPSAVVTRDATEFDVVGVGGDFQLSWHKPRARSAETPTVLEATGTVLTRLDGRSISDEAMISVRSFGAGFDRFSVRLPPGAELSAGSPRGYTVTPLDAKTKGSQALVEVRLAKKTSGPVEVRLACRRSYDPVRNRAWCELGGFDVVGAVRQSGFVAVATSGDWQVQWGTSSDLRQTDQLPDLLRKEDITAGFEYFAQPYSLTARLAPRKTHVSVDAAYVMLVDHDAVRLDGKLTYTIRRAKLATLELVIPGWELDEAGPDTLVAVDGVTQTGDELAIPLLQPSAGTIELQVRAHRAIKAGTKLLTVSLPQPRAGSVGPVSLAVVAADNVQLTPNSQKMVGLVRQRSGPSMALPERQQDPLYYRGSGGEAEFAADFCVHAQQISVDVASQATLDLHRAEVEQKQSYTIAYEPVDHLTITVPRALSAAKRLQVLYDGKPLQPVAVTDDAETPVAMRVNLPSPCIGACELVLRYSLPIIEPTPQHASTISLPLPMPENVRLLTNTLSVKETANIRMSAKTNGPWSVPEHSTEASGDQADVRLTATGTTDRVDLELRCESEIDATVIDRVWMQSWLTSSAQQDLAAYQLTTKRKELEVVVPVDAVADQVSVWVDGKRVETSTIGTHRLLIPLAGQGENRRYVIELHYQFPGTRPMRGAMTLEFPKFGPKTWIRRMYWQLVLPANEHLMANPAGFTSECTWGRHGCCWGRQPLLNQTQLESWVGVTKTPALPERDNVYLFSTLGRVERVDVHTAGRTWIVLWASGVALVAGLLLIYVPVSRHPAALLTVGLTLLAAGLIVPEPTLLLAQAASLGLVLTLMAGLLERGVARRRRRAIIRKEPSSSLIELGSTRTPYRLPTAGNLASTDMMPVVEPQSTEKIDR